MEKCELIYLFARRENGNSERTKWKIGDYSGVDGATMHIRALEV